MVVDRSGTNPLGSRAQWPGPGRVHRPAGHPGWIDCRRPARDSSQSTGRLFRIRAIAESQCAVVLAVLVASILLLLVPATNASPTDPLWIPGYYDGADYDDVVYAISSGLSAATAPGVSGAARPIWIEHGFIVGRWSPIARARALEYHGSRAPPRSLA